MRAASNREFHRVVAGILKDLQPDANGLCLEPRVFSKWACVVVTHVDREEISVELMIVVRRLLRGGAATAAAQLSVLVAITVGVQQAGRLAVDAGVDPNDAKRLVQGLDPSPGGPGDAMKPPKERDVPSKKR
ncbi:MAG: hypothetical protein V3T05_12890 [Myxococcota bacterium]